MVSIREMMLRETYEAILTKKMISINEINSLMDQVEKVLMNIIDVTESRDKWKKKYQGLKDAGKKNDNN
jgi:hypothetical protein